jgi:hypothetical protein
VQQPLAARRQVRRVDDAGGLPSRVRPKVHGCVPDPVQGQEQPRAPGQQDRLVLLPGDPAASAAVSVPLHPRPPLRPAGQSG